MKIIKLIRHYVAAYRIKKENQIRKEYLDNKIEIEAMDYLRNWEMNKNNQSYLFLRGGL